MLGLSVVPALLQFLGFLFLPESPRWLIQKGLTQKARRVLSQIRGNQNIDEEYDSIKSSIEEEEKDCGGGEKIVLQALNSHASSSKKHKYSLSSLKSNWARCPILLLEVHFPAHTWKLLVFLKNLISSEGSDVGRPLLEGGPPEAGLDTSVLQSILVWCFMCNGQRMPTKSC